MSILFTLVMTIIIIGLGVGWNAWSLALIVILLTAGLSFLITSIDAEEIKKNWDAHRCEADVIFTSFLYKPANDDRSALEFSKDNMSFCVRHVIREGLKILITPIFTILGKQLDAASVMGDIFNGIRTLQANAMFSFKQIFNPMFKRYADTMIAFILNYKRMLSAMKRVGAVALSTVYIGISLQTFIENTVKFVVKVAMIMLGIMAGLIILLWFALLPTLPLIFAVIASITAVAATTGISAGGVGRAFCFSPDTKIHLEDGTSIPIEKCKAGHVLHDGSVVEGILETEGMNESIYSLDGILVSGSHLVWSSEDNEWISVSDIKSAKNIGFVCKRLICLRTNTRNIPILGQSGVVWKFRDWEELPDDVNESDSLWDWLVNMILNAKPGDKKVPHDYPMLRKGCDVLHKTGEKRGIETIHIGDEIYDENGFTKVIGIYEGTEYFENDEVYTDGVWLRKHFESSWKHPEVEGVNREKDKGYHIITESGSFWIESKKYSGFVRDFTEVGSEHLFLTYNFTKKLLKKSLSREESCKRDSLSQDLLSSWLQTF